MKKIIFTISGLLFFVAIVPVHAATCTPVTTDKGPYTTAYVAHSNETINGNIDATGCDLGVYVGHSVKNVNLLAKVHDANSYGVLIDGNASINNAEVYNIGNHVGNTYTPNGVQTGVAIYFDYYATAASGSVNNSKVYNYQKGGIVVNGSGTKATVTNNTVTGAGHVNYIAQNGIQVGYGASATVSNNNVSGNSYTGPNQAVSGGILVVGGPLYSGDYTVGTDIENNRLTNNDVGVYLSNLDGNGNAPTTIKTKIKTVNNIISSDGLYNTTGNGATGYQAGVSDVGNGDSIVNNNISGNGYSSTAHPGQSFGIDANSSFTNHVHLVNNLAVH